MKTSSRLYYVIKLLTYIKEFIWQMILYLFCGGVFRVLPIVTSGLTAYMIGHVFAGGKIEIYLVAFIIVLAALRGLFSYLDCIISHDIAYKILSKFRVMLYEAIARLSPSYLSTKRTGKLINTAMNDVELLEWFYAHVVGVFLLAIIIPGTTFVVLYNINPLIAAVIVPWIIAVVSIPRIFKKQANEQGAKVREKNSTIIAVVIDGIQGLKDIISYNWQKNYINKFKLVATDYEKANIQYCTRKGTESLLIKVFMSMAMLSVVLVSAYLYKSNLITIEWYMVAVVLSGAIFAPISEIMSMSSQFGMIFSAAKRVYDILEAKPYVNDNGQLLTAALEPTIEFKNVYFKYPNAKRNALNNVCFKINAGEKIAIVGSSGAGKSTCSKLLMKFWQPDKGQILIGGKDIATISGDSIRKNISLVSQDVYLFSRSITENIKLLHDYSDTEVYNSAKKASIHDFIINLPEGYDTEVGERGAKLSGGEKQRISIARAFMKNSSMLILDESSSNLDSINEEKINASLEDLMKNKTTIIIAHKLSTIKLCDKIIVLNNGCLDNQGTLTELMNSSQMFNKIINEGR